MPMAGRGSRFFENGFVMPKPLIEINDRPFFYWATQSIAKFVDCADITFVVLEEHIRDHAIDREIKTYYPDAKIVALPEVTEGAAITALRYDKADALWLSDMRYGIYVESTSGGSVATREILFGFRLNYGGQEQEMYDQQMASAQAIADKVDRDADLYEQVMQVHDLLAAQSTYNKEPADSTAETISSVFFRFSFA